MPPTRHFDADANCNRFSSRDSLTSCYPVIDGHHFRGGDTVWFKNRLAYQERDPHPHGVTVGDKISHQDRHPDWVAVVHPVCNPRFVVPHPDEDTRRHPDGQHHTHNREV